MFGEERRASHTSFCVAHGSAMSYLASTPHGRLPDTYVPKDTNHTCSECS